jgi:hypothetical protein
MLYTLAVVLLILWLLGVVSGYTVGNFIYGLLILAVILFILGAMRGRSAVP